MVAVAVAMLAGVLVFAVMRPWGLPEVFVALPAAAAVVAFGVVTPHEVEQQLRTLFPTVAFLAVILVLGHLADALGVFAWVASVLVRRANHDPRRLLNAVFVTSAVVTAVLSLDATVVLLTPIVLRAATALRMSPRPHVYATGHLANSASLLMPVSNLTNLLAFTATGLTFMHFTVLMTLPWLAVVLVEGLVFRWFFARDLASLPPLQPDPIPPVHAPRYALGIVAATLVGFAATGPLGIEPVWAAAMGAAALAVPALRRHRTTPRRVLAAADLWFCVFVFALAVVVAGVSSGPVGDALANVLPTEPSLGALLGVAAAAAVAANVVNNIPATLMLLTALGPGAPPALILAALLGVNLGPNLTYVGSLATMLWRRLLEGSAGRPDLYTYTRLGVITTPLTLVVAVLALWIVT
ncbi:SLC13 family permease [Rhodococcus aetherivorans]